MSDQVLNAAAVGAIAFALMAVIAALCAVVVRLIVMALARTKKRVPVVAPELKISVLPAQDNAATIAAVIAAAVHASLGPHRVVSLTERPRSANWISEVRTQHHQSHSPHR